MMRIDLKSVEHQAGTIPLVHDKENLCNSMGFSTTATTVCHPTDRTVHTMIIVTLVLHWLEQNYQYIGVWACD